MVETPRSETCWPWAGVSSKAPQVSATRPRAARLPAALSASVDMVAPAAQEDSAAREQAMLPSRAPMGGSADWLWAIARPGPTETACPGIPAKAGGAPEDRKGGG